MLCVCTKRVCVCNTELVCKAVRMAFSCQTSAIALPFIPIPCSMYIVQLLNCMQGARCDSIYIVQLLYCTFLAVTVFTLYSCWTTGSQLWEYVHYTVIVPAVTVCTLYSHCTVGSQLWRKCLLLYSYCTAGPQLLRRCMYIIQLLYCRVPAVREVYVHYIVIVLQDSSCEGGVCILYSYCTAGSQLWGRCMYII